MKSFKELLHEEQLARLGSVVDALLACYGLSAVEFTLLQYENNAVYRIVTKAEEQFVIRVATVWGRSEEEQRSEMQWLEALCRETCLRVPEPVRNLEGELVTMIGDHPCVVLQWLPGKPPAKGLKPDLIEQIGALTAEMHRFSEQFAPERFVRPRWDWERLFGGRSILQDENASTMLSSRQRVVLGEAAEEIGRALSRPEKGALCAGLIHADLHTDNILIDGSGVGVIDFDDCGHGCYLFDIACVLDSFKRRVLVDRAEYREGKAALLLGYTRIRPLAPGFDEYLGIFMAMRAMVTLDFILRSKNANVHAWGRSSVAGLIDQIHEYLDDNPL